MRMYDLIMKKRNGIPHTEEEIRFIVDGYTNGNIPDYQMSAWLMAVYYQGMTKEETVMLTLAMKESGDQLDLSDIDGVKVDKHSTGGVGDKTTFIVGPILATLGVPIAKMSGRGLGHTGGTIDKLESIPGFNVTMPNEQFVHNVNTYKLALVSQTGNLAPADKKIYALRDVTATVDSLPLIASSVMSKKIAAGADVIVLDVKCGSGAFMKEEEEAKALAKIMVDIGNMAGRKTYGLITDMNEPLGCKVGNSLEVQEAVEVLSIKNVEEVMKQETKGLGRITEVSLQLATYMYLGANQDKDISVEVARKLCIEAIESGKALEKFAEFVHNQSGDKEYIYHPEKLTNVKFVEPVYFKEEGYITSCKTSEVGMVNLVLGGGRATKESTIDINVGIDIKKHIGDFVKKDEPFAYLYSNDENNLVEAKTRLINAYTIGKEAVTPEKLVKAIIE